MDSHSVHDDTSDQYALDMFYSNAPPVTIESHPMVLGSDQDYVQLLEVMEAPKTAEGSVRGDLEGTSRMSSTPVTLEKNPMNFASDQNYVQLLEGWDDPKTADGSVRENSEGTWQKSMGGATVAVAGTVLAAASAITSGRFSDAQRIVGEAVGSLVGTAANAAVPASLQPMKNKAGQFVQKAQPWWEFFLPLSFPSVDNGFSRLTSNFYLYQSNYAVLFVLNLLLTLLLQPSAVVTILILVTVWVFFLKKNEDPEWHPKVGGAELGPWQRWLLLAAITGFVMLTVAGSHVLNTSLCFVGFTFVHAVVHDSSSRMLPAPADSPVPL